MSAARRIVAVGARRGGVADVFARVVAELRARGHEVELVAVPRRRWLAAGALRAAWRARSALGAADTVHLEFGSGDLEVFWFALGAMMVRRGCVLVAHDHPEIAHAPAAALVPTDGRLPRALGFRVLSPALDGWLSGLAARRAGVLVVFGEAAADEWRRRGLTRVRAIAHGSDPPRPGPAPPSAGESVLFAGFIGPGKGVDVLLAAWGRVRGQIELPLVLAGGADPPHDSWLAGQLAVLGEGPSPPRVLGPVPAEADFQGLIERAAVVVLPYRRSSPASGILLRAMRAGRAIVTTPVPAVRDLIRDGESGLLVRAGDPEALAQAIARLAGDGALRDRLGAAAAATLARERSWGRHLDGLEQAYALADPLRPR